MNKKRITDSVSIPEIEKAIQSLPKENEVFVDHTFDISEYITYLIKELGITQKNLSILLDKNEPEISKWLSGRHNFTLRTISKLEAVLPMKIINPNIKNFLNSKKSKINITSSVINRANSNNTTVNIFVLENANMFSLGELTSSYSTSTSHSNIQELPTVEYAAN